MDEDAMALGSSMLAPETNTSLNESKRGKSATKAKKSNFLDLSSVKKSLKKISSMSRNKSNRGHVESGERSP